MKIKAWLHFSPLSGGGVPSIKPDALAYVPHVSCPGDLLKLGLWALLFLGLYLKSKGLLCISQS